MLLHLSWWNWRLRLLCFYCLGQMVLGTDGIGGKEVED